MDVQKTKNAVLLSGLLLSGCAVKTPVHSDSETIQAHSILEQADRNDLRLESYRMSNRETFESEVGIEKTEFDVRVQFTRDCLYMISDFPEGSYRLARYELKNGRKHSIDGANLNVRSGTWAFLDETGKLQDCFQVENEMQVEDYISIPEAYLYSKNTYEILDSSQDSTEIRIENLVSQGKKPEGLQQDIRLTVGSDGYLQNLSATEAGPNQQYVYRKNRDFSDFNISLMNTEALDEFLNKAASKELKTGDSVSISDFEISGS